MLNFISSAFRSIADRKRGYGLRPDPGYEDPDASRTVILVLRYFAEIDEPINVATVRILDADVPTIYVGMITPGDDSHAIEITPRSLRWRYDEQREGAFVGPWYHVGAPDMPAGHETQARNVARVVREALEDRFPQLSMWDNVSAAAVHSPCLTH
jgi:hypothetical protein